MRPPAALALLLLACGGSEAPVAPPDNLTEDVTIEVGRPFPSLALPALADGEPLSLASFRGKKTLLHVFASW